MKSYEDRLSLANAQLLPYAVPHEGKLGRDYAEPEDDQRFPFQRDHGRILHTTAFRRLKGKTQVFVTGQGDHYRTRLTHTLEVAQISRDIARTLSLNEDLAECIALAHDLGHPPFGHSGEDALNVWMKQYGSSFEHNIQSHRIVTLLEYHSSLYRGLNLNKEVLEGLMKHRTPHDQSGMQIDHSPTLEAQLVNIADEIAYTAHDCDDGMHEELFSAEILLQVPLAKEAHEKTIKRHTSLRGAIIDVLTSDLYKASSQRIEDRGIASLDDVYAQDEPVIEFSDTIRNELNTLRGFLWKNMYMHPQVLRKSDQGKSIVHALCTHFYDHPSDKIIDLQKENDQALHEAVKDYVSGMTDRFAMELAHDLRID